MNWYCSLTRVKNRLGITDTSSDTVLGQIIEQASRMIDDHCHRHFYVEKGTRYFNGRVLDALPIDDVLVVTTLTADSEGDQTHDGETWTEGTDYVLRPDNRWPKDSIWLHPNGRYSFTDEDRYMKLTGFFGHGDGRSSNPVEALAATISITNGTTTTATLSADNSEVEVGETILVGTEQCFVSAKSTVTLTIERGMNGTTAAAATGAACYVYRYPTRINQYAVILACEVYNAGGKMGIMQERIGDYYYMLSETRNAEGSAQRVLGPYIRREFGG